jgi:hypothetical protein
MSITSIDPNLLVHTNGIERMRIDSNGLVGIGTTIPRASQVIMPRIEKVANGYTVGIEYEIYIAENIEQVNGIISAQLLKLGAT